MKKIIGISLPKILSIIVFQSCRSYPEIRRANSVDINTFMGDWFVIANIPTFIEKGAHNALERYTLKPNGTIDTRFSFNKNSLDGPKKEYNPTGFLTDDPSNAEWRMQFLWPFKSEFIIVYVDPNYEHTIIGRTKRDYLWIMSRSPNIDSDTLNRLIAIAVEEGYDREMIRLIPHG